MNLTAPVALSRSIILMVDDETMPIGEEQRLRATLTRFVRSLPEQDQVSLVTVPHGGVVVGLTTDREKLAKGIATLQPITPIDDPACRSRSTLGVLETTMTRLIAQRANDQPVVVAFLSASLSGQSVQEQAQHATITGAGGVTAQAGSCPIRADDFVKVGQAQANARVQLYVINPDYSPASVNEGIESLRSMTGAPLLHLTSSGEPGLNRMARETSGYYLATFDTAQDELTGKPHQSKVTTTRQNIDVRDRPYLIVGKDVASPGAFVRPDAATGTITTAYDMVRSGRAFRDLPLRGTAWSSRNAKVGSAIDVIAVFEPVDPNTKIMQAAAALFDENGVAQAYWPPDPTQSAMTTWPVTVGLTVKPGDRRQGPHRIDRSAVRRRPPESRPVAVGRLVTGRVAGRRFHTTSAVHERGLRDCDVRFVRRPRRRHKDRRRVRSRADDRWPVDVQRERDGVADVRGRQVHRHRHDSGGRARGRRLCHSGHRHGRRAGLGTRNPDAAQGLSSRPKTRR
jgi:hypothetical protein